MRAGELTVGPFSISVTGLIVSIAGWLTGPVLIAAGLQSTHIECVRRPEVVCAMTDGPTRRRSSGWFVPSAVHSTHERRSGKNRHYEVGQVVLTAEDGRRHAALQVDYEESQAVADRLQRFLTDASARKVEEELHGPRAISVLGVVFLVLGALLGRAALRGGGRLRFTLVAPGKLRVRRSFAGLPLGSQTLDVAKATGVSLEWKQRKDPLAKSRAPTESFARLLIQTPHGAMPVSRTFSRGQRIHYLNAQRLAQFLGVRSTTPRVEEPAQPGFDWSSAGGRFAGLWIGACVGSLVGVALGAVGALTLGGASLSDSAGGVWYFGSMAAGAVAGMVSGVYLTSRGRTNR